MANHEHLTLLKQGVRYWNRWKEEHSDIKIDLSNCFLIEQDLRNADLSGVNLNRTNLSMTNLTRAKLVGADLTRATLTRANLVGADLTRATLTEAKLYNVNLHKAILLETNLHKADLQMANVTEAVLIATDLREARLECANLGGANLTRAKLRNANLTYASIVNTVLNGADLTGCFIYGISAWDVKLKDAIQSNLVVTPHEQSAITVDKLMVAQFIYMLLNNKNLQDVIDTITSKVVLILGRFTDKRKIVLDAIRDELRNKYDYTPVVFDFDPPHNTDLTHTVLLLASLSQFIIADITEPNSIGHELATIVPHLRDVPVQLLLEAKYKEFPMVETFAVCPSVQPILVYREEELYRLLTNLEDIIDSLKQVRIELAVEKAKKLVKKYVS